MPLSADQMNLYKSSEPPKILNPEIYFLTTLTIHKYSFHYHLMTIKKYFKTLTDIKGSVPT